MRGLRWAASWLPAYMSPEQARGQAVDKRTDVWAFGCVLFEMLSGQRAFGGDTITDTLARVLEREPEWESLPSDTPPSVRNLLRRCLRKDPEKRLHDIADARIEIDECDLLSASASVDTRRFDHLASIVAAILILSALAVVAIVLIVRRDVTAARTRAFRVRRQCARNGLTARIWRLRCRPRRPPDRRHSVLEQPVKSLGAAHRYAAVSADSRDRRRDLSLLETGWFGDRVLRSGKAQDRARGRGSPDYCLRRARIREGTEYDEVGGTWNRDDVIVFMSSAFALQRVSARTGAPPVAITTLGKGETAHRWPFFLPDGERFLYLVLRRTW